MYNRIGVDPKQGSVYNPDMHQTSFTRSVLTDLENRANLLGLKFTAICREAGIAYSTFSRWRAGSTDPFIKVGKLDAVIRKYEDSANK